MREIIKKVFDGWKSILSLIGVIASLGLFITKNIDIDNLKLLLGIFGATGSISIMEHLLKWIDGLKEWFEDRDKKKVELYKLKPEEPNKVK